MRTLLLAIWAVLTGLTLYSAFWHKAPAIEADITERTTKAITDAGGDNVAVMVDGRHVALRGQVADAATETNFLSIADDTFGALGPNDQLVVPQVARKTFFRADRGADGIRLTGVIGSEEERSALVEAAQAVNAGGVDDQMIVGGGQADWLNDAKSGIAQLGGLTAGALYVASDERSISGSAADAASAASANGLGDTWRTYVSAPALEDPRIATLTADVASRDTMIGSLKGEVGTLKGEIGTLTGDLETSKGRIDALTEGVSDRDAQIADLTGRYTDLESEKNGIMAKLGESESALASATGNLGTSANKIAELTAALGTAKAMATDTNKASAEYEAQLAEKDTAYGALKTQFDGATQRITTLEGDLVASKAEAAEMIASKDEMIASIKKDAGDVDTRITELQGVITTRDTRITELETGITGFETQVAELQTGITNRDAQISELSGLIGERDTQISQLNGVIGERDTEIVGLKETTAGSATKIADLMSQNQGFTTRISDLEAALQDNQTQEPVVSTANAIATCNRNAALILETGRINFVTNRAEITAESIPLLSQIADLTLDCADEGFGLIVGGHTDSQGSEAYNQQLSEARAQAVRDFVISRGANANTITATGFGEAEPIATNDTAEGRAQNRRISFEWTSPN